MNAFGPGAKIDAQRQFVRGGVKFGFVCPFFDFLSILGLFSRFCFQPIEFLLQRLHLPVILP